MLAASSITFLTLGISAVRLVQSVTRLGVLCTSLLLILSTLDSWIRASPRYFGNIPSYDASCITNWTLADG